MIMLSEIEHTRGISGWEDAQLAVATKLAAVSCQDYWSKGEPPYKIIKLLSQ